MTSGVQEYVVGRRYLHAKSHLPVTLRYVGPLPPLSSLKETVDLAGSVGLAGPSAAPIWLGIEYDDPAHGKHSGTFQDQQVFAVRQEGSGAFVKLSAGARPLIDGPTFVEVFEERYGHIDPAVLPDGDYLATESIIKLGSSGIDVEAPGLEEVQRRIGKLEKLREVGLESRWIPRLGATPELKETMRQRLRGVKVLNVSRNLLSSWSDVGEIVGVLPELTTLVLKSALGFFGPLQLISSESRLEPLTSAPHEALAVLKAALRNVRALHLGRSFVSWSEMNLLACILPQLETLHLNGNPLTPDRVSESPMLPHLISISVDECRLESWGNVLAILKAVPSLSTLDISSNSFAAITPSTLRYDKITSLILLSSKVTQWSDIDQLGGVFPNLDSLRFSISPEAQVTTTAERLTGDDTSDRPIIIAKLPALGRLNGSAITKAERREAESIYLAHVDKLPGGSRSSWGRYDELCRLHRPAKTHEDPPVVLSRKLGASIGSRMMSDYRQARECELVLISALYVHPSHDLKQRMNMSVLPASTVTLLKKKLARRIGEDVAWGDITIWTARNTPEGLLKVAQVDDEEEVGRWLAHDEDVIAEWHAS